MNVAQIFVAVVSIAVIAMPFVWSARLASGDDIDQDYALPAFFLGLVALFWVGFTALAFIAELGQ